MKSEDQSVESLFHKLKSGINGLTETEALKRSRFFGLNEIAKKKKTIWVLKFLSYFKNPLIVILLIAALISGLTGEIKNFVIIVLMVFLSVVLNFYQELKSNLAAEKIAKKLAVHSTVIRNDIEKEIPTKFIVPGDIVQLTAGDIIPADGQIISCDDFFINESVLTGESFPVEKFTEDTKNTVFSGTIVISGYAKIIVTKTGKETEFGKIADRLETPAETNAFELGIKSFGYLIIKVIIGIVLLIFLINAVKHKDIIDSFIFSLAVAVGVTPELLPVILSINLAKGSIKMADGGVIVKRLNSIPDFGSMDILCTDKTGTLTEDRITLVKFVDVYGNDCQDVLKLAYINGSFETGIKSILDKAIMDYQTFNINDLEKIDEIPYDFLRKRSSIIYKSKADNNRLMVSKGAPEEIIKICSQYSNCPKDKVQNLTDEMSQKIMEVYDNLSAQGLRVLAIATKDVADNKKIYSVTEEGKMIFYGFVAFYDPPKKDVKSTLVFMKEHGIEIKILTGDSAIVTQKICQDINLEVKGIITGDQIDIDKMGDDTLAQIALKNTIFARISPTQKEAIILALKKQNLVVGYLGDGINDAPSLKSADVGISVNNAVDVAKETADIILMRKSLKELMDGVIEGRKTFGNTMKYLMMGLSSNFGNMFSMIGAVLYLPFFPMLPGQILLNNFLYDISQLAIPMDNVDPDYLRKPKHWNMKFIKYFMFIFGPISSLFDILTFIMLFGIFGLTGAVFQTGWFVESLATQTLVIYIIRTRKIPFFQSWPSKYLLASTLGAVLIGFIIGNTFLGSYFGFSVLPLKAIISIILLVVVYLFMVQIVKQLFYKYLFKKLNI